MGTRWGTAHFVSQSHAVRYYRPYFGGSLVKAESAVERKMEQEEIYIGEPSVKAGQKLTIDTDGRYWIEEAQKGAMLATLALLLVGTFGGLAHGQELPDAPRPKPETFLHNRVNRGLVISAFVARAADAQSTEQALHNACHCVTEGGSFYGLAPLAPVAERPAAFWMYSMTMATAESYAAKVLWDHANHSHHPKAYKLAARGLLAWNANANFADARVNWSHDRKATAIYGRK